jgi:hypothetical protein
LTRRQGWVQVRRGRRADKKYGRDINWTFTTHDVATIFRRFLTLMPEPIVPLSLYHDFRGALTVDDPVARYKELIRAMPSANQHLLLYVLDVLHLFAGRSDKNLMTAASEHSGLTGLTQISH